MCSCKMRNSLFPHFTCLQKRRSARQTGKRKKYLDDIDLHLSDDDTTPQMASVLADISMDADAQPGSSNVSIMGADEVAGVGEYRGS